MRAVQGPAAAALDGFGMARETGQVEPRITTEHEYEHEHEHECEHEHEHECDKN
ncbi:MAG: hypothetical protein GY733_00365 [bacterium]|nr:hypothetical protein [bacterium]